MKVNFFNQPFLLYIGDIHRISGSVTNYPINNIYVDNFYWNSALFVGNIKIWHNKLNVYP